MHTEKFTRLYHKIEDHLLSEMFTEAHQLSADVITDFIEGEDFRRELKNIIISEIYNTKDIFHLFYPLFDEIILGDRPEDLLTYIQQYGIHLMFPEANDFERMGTGDKIATLFMEVMRIFVSELPALESDRWETKYPLTFLTENEVAQLEDPTEYLSFMRAFREEFVYESMKVTQDVKGYTTLDHVAGVHHLAMKVGRQLKHTGLPVDLGRVSGAAAGHDIGKFGCKPGEQQRIAYYHYYYTGEWFSKHGIVYIRNVAINHSTWDLELENLSLESLLLIYSDFRVKGNEQHQMQFYSLDDSFNIILNKLDNVDEAKEKRYRRVYAKLKDFENYMLQLGVNVDPENGLDIDETYEKKRKYFALQQGEAIVENTKFSSIEHNIKLMYRLRNESSLNKMLESARDVKDLSELRGYIQVLEEYSTYLTHKQKLITLKFLYERLMIPEEDIRKQCAVLLGSIIGNFDDEIRKELPEGAEFEKPIIASIDLFEKYLGEILFPALRIIEKHQKWIRTTAPIMIRSYFSHIRTKEKKGESVEIILNYFEESSHEDRLFIMDMTKGLPLDDFSNEQLTAVTNYVFENLKSENIEVRLTAYDNLICMLPFIKDDVMGQVGIDRYFNERFITSDHPAERYAIYKFTKEFIEDEGLSAKYRDHCEVDAAQISDLFLSNLKSATYDIVKKFQIELLFRHTFLDDYGNGFYTAMHFCNLLKVSTLESVRHNAGDGLVNLVPFLSYEQKNDIVVELIRALEMESYQFTRYIPDYLGKILLHIPPVELDEILDEFKKSIKQSNSQIATLVLKTVGYTITNYAQYRNLFKEPEDKYNERLITMIGIVFNGFVNYNSQVNQTAFRVLGKYIMGSNKMTLDQKSVIFELTCKKTLELMFNTDEKIELVFYNNASGMMYFYRFISDYNFYKPEPLSLKTQKKVAFFPGAYDPFTLSHKQIAKEIRDMGFEVYLAIDEFSWSKRTQPNMIRRNIVKMSVADELDIYSFPRDLPINIANKKDMKRLRNYFEDSEVYIVVGSDVILNASAYKKEPDIDSVTGFPHVIFERRTSEYEIEDAMLLDERIGRLDSRSIRLKLPVQYENISSTRIRNYIDESRDISELIDPLAQRYIYDRGLYLREPQFKEVMTTKAFNIEVVDRISNTLLEEMAHTLGLDFSETFMKLKETAEVKNIRALVLRSVDENRNIMGFSLFRWLKSKDIFLEFEDQDITDYIRDNSIGRIILIDGIYVTKKSKFKHTEQMVLTETLAFCLAKDYTYAVCRDILRGHMEDKVINVLERQGFMEIDGKENGIIYAVNMTSPVTLSLDCKSMIKEPFRNNPKVVEVILEAREKLQRAIVDLYPGNLVLSFDRTMIYEHLIKKICDENNMPTIPLKPKTTGEYMCIPFGAVFKRWLLPNTVTKSLHLEKYFDPSLMSNKIKSSPYYLDEENQVKIIKSYDRSILLVDDILNKGYRMRALKPLFDKYDVDIKKIFVGILSGRGKALMEQQNIEVDSAYFIPRLKVWFYESKLYPFIGGDVLWRGKFPERNLIPSINLILPYSSGHYIKGATKKSIYDLSEVCIQNSIDILCVLESEYQAMHERMLTLAHLGEVMVTPMYTDKGGIVDYDLNYKASDYLRRDLEQLKRLKQVFTEK